MVVNEIYFEVLWQAIAGMNLRCRFNLSRRNIDVRTCDWILARIILIDSYGISSQAIPADGQTCQRLIEFAITNDTRATVLLPCLHEVLNADIAIHVSITHSRGDTIAVICVRHIADIRGRFALDERTCPPC